MVMGDWSVAILFWQLSIDHIVNVQCKRCGLAKTRLRHPSLPFDSLPYLTRTIRRRVRTYFRSITWQPHEKRLTIFYEYRALSHARVGAPLWGTTVTKTTSTGKNFCTEPRDNATLRYATMLRYTNRKPSQPKLGQNQEKRYAARTLRHATQHYKASSTMQT